MWLSFHLDCGENPYDEKLDALLVEQVAPLVGRLASEGRLRRSFFVRYGDPRSHLRLRLEPARPEDAAALVREEVLSHFREPRPQEIEYVPELDRYGGLAGVDVAEDCFHVSSDIALSVLASTRGRGRSAVLGKSVLLTVAMAWSFLEDLTACRAFLDRYAASYARRLAEAEPGEQSEPSAEPTPLEREAVDGAIAALVAALVSVWTQGAELGNPHLDRWVRGCSAVRRRLRETARPADAEIARAGGLPGLLASYLHMHHNRLGLSIRQEIALASLAAGSLARLEPSQ